MRDLAAVDARAMDAADDRLKLMAEGLIADTAADLARMEKITVGHAAMRAYHLLHLAAVRFLRMLPIAEDSLEEIIHRDIFFRLQHEIAIFRRTALTKILIYFSFRTDLHDMHTGLILFTIVTKHKNASYEKFSRVISRDLMRCTRSAGSILL